MRHDRVLAEYESRGYLSRRTLHEELREVCLRQPGSRAVVAADATLTYAQLDRAITGYARDFLAKGLSRGDQVLLQLPNSAAYVVTLFALMRIGVVPTLLLPSHRRSEVTSLAHELHPVAYIGGRDQLGFDCVEMVEQLDPGTLGTRFIYADSGAERDGDVPRHRLPGLQVGEASDCLNAVDAAAASLASSHHRDVALNLLSGGTPRSSRECTRRTPTTRGPLRDAAVSAPTASTWRCSPPHTTFRWPTPASWEPFSTVEQSSCATPRPSTRPSPRSRPTQ